MCLGERSEVPHLFCRPTQAGEPGVRDEKFLMAHTRAITNRNLRVVSRNSCNAWNTESIRNWRVPVPARVYSDGHRLSERLTVAEPKWSDTTLKITTFSHSFRLGTQKHVLSMCSLADYRVGVDRDSVETFNLPWRPRLWPCAQLRPSCFNN